MFSRLLGGSPNCTENITSDLEIQAWLLVISGNQGTFLSKKEVPKLT